MKKSKLSRHITWHVIGIMVFFNVLIIGAILIFVFYISLLNGSNRGLFVIDGISGKTETMLRAVEIASANNRAEVEANLGSPEQVFDALERELLVNNMYIGCFAAFEPDYFKGQGRWFEAYAFHNDSSRIEKQQIGSPKHDYFNGTWYEKGFRLDRDDEGYLTDPYFDNSVDSSMYCSFVLPIFDKQDRKVGVYGVDLNLEWLDTAIKEEMVSVKKEFVSDEDTIAYDGVTYFSIQIIDSKGNRITGSDSLDISILKGVQLADSKYEMKDLKGSPFYIHTKRLGHTGWTLVVFQHYELVFYWGMVTSLIIMFFMFIGGIVIFFFTTKSIRSATKPLGFLSDSAQEIAKGNFDTVLPTFKNNDEIAQLRDSFDTMQQSLKRYVEQLKESTAAKASIDSELNVAYNIQMSMLPQTFPAFPDRKDIDLFASLTPAKGVGGDLYDFFIRDEMLFFCIGDVSGKGVPAALVMAVTRTLFRNIAAHNAEPNHIVEAINQSICEGNDNCMFVTLFVGVLDLKTGLLRYCNAGHEAPMINGKQLPCISNLPVGVMSDCNYSEQETNLVPGTTLFLYTDGLTEAENESHELFGRQRVIDMMKALNGSTMELIRTMTNTVYRFAGNTEQSDDLTMLAINYKPEKGL